MKVNNVLFTENCLRSINEIITQHELVTEIGGTLVGYQQHDHLIITHASGPGENAKMSFNSIEIDGEYATRYCNKINELSDHQLYFLGDWHTHLSDNLNPSNRDLVAMKRLSKYTPAKYRDSLITIIANHYKPTKFKVYSLNKGSKLKTVSYSMIPNPGWIQKFI
jgi:integrative and conjugative element protein (TIGR02256 family)